MEKYTKRFILLFIFILIVLPLAGLQAEDTNNAAATTTTSSTTGTASDAKFGFGLGLGVATFGDVTFQKLALGPELTFGPFGVGLDVNIHFRFVNGVPEFRLEDWVPTTPDFFSALGLYLAKIKYIRYGAKGDPLHVKFGSIDDFMVGTGFIVGNYTNTLFVPKNRLFGMQFDLDGRLFNFPYIGLETFAGDVSRFDVFGSRLFVRPLCSLDIPVIKDLQIGGTIALDTAPYRYSDATTIGEAQTAAINTTQAYMLVFGGDIILPILNIDKLFTLATFGDVASIKGKSIGSMIGFGGKLINMITYGAQIRMLGANFIPTYFDATYDITRAERYLLVEGNVTTPGYLGWFASLGTSISENLFIFKLSLEGSFTNIDNNPNNYLNYPQLKGTLALNEGLIPGIFFDATYDKKLIRDLNQIFVAEGSLIKARINYKTGPAVISFFYQLNYSANDWTKPEITSGLESFIQF